MERFNNRISIQTFKLPLAKHLKRTIMSLVSLISITVLTLDGVDQSIEYGIRHCQDMANIIQRLINDGKYCLLSFELIVAIHQTNSAEQQHLPPIEKRNLTRHVNTTASSLNLFAY